MRNDLILLLSCLTLSQSCSLTQIDKQPHTTVCITSSTDGKPVYACHDKRVEEPFTLPYAENYICRSSQDYDKISQYIMYLRKEAEKCR